MARCGLEPSIRRWISSSILVLLGFGFQRHNAKIYAMTQINMISHKVLCTQIQALLFQVCTMELEVLMVIVLETVFVLITAQMT